MVDFLAIMKEMKLKKSSKQSVAAPAEQKEQNKEVKSDNEDECADFQISDLSPRQIVFDGLNNTSVEMLENISGTSRGGNGATIWDCSIVLTQYLLDNQMENLCGSRTLELGSGLGLPSITLAKVDKCQMIASERPIMMDMLKENCCYNFHPENSKYWQYKQSQNLGSKNLNENVSNSKDPDVTKHLNMMPTLLSLDWTSSEDLNRIADMSFDYIIGADLLFASNKYTWEGLANIYQTLLQNRESELKSMKETKKKLAWLAYEPRDSFVFEEFFNVLLQKRGIFYERVTSSITVIPHDIHIFVLYCE
jgi:predicted nicotinamide N-methyase